MATTRKPRRLYVELDADLWRKVERAARADDRTVASFARAALRDAAERMLAAKPSRR